MNVLRRLKAQRTDTKITQSNLDGCTRKILATHFFLQLSKLRKTYQNLSTSTKFGA